MAKLVGLIREKPLPKFTEGWKMLIDFLHEKENEVMVSGFED